MKAITLSFDDGHPADLKVAERLARHGLTATFYVPVRNSEGQPVIDAAQLQALAASGFEIGGHTLDHRRLVPLGKAEARRQIADGKKALEDRLGEAIHGFAYPGGAGGRREQRLVEEAGFAYARTTEMFRLDRGSSILGLPTTLQFYPHRPPALLRNWLRRGGGWHRLMLALTLLRQAGVENSAQYLLPRMVDGQVLHIWGHGWEIDRFDLWQAFDELLRLLAASGVPCLTNNLVAGAGIQPPPAAGTGS